MDSDQLSTQLLNAPPTQITAFLAGEKGTVLCSHGNVGNLYSISTGPVRQRHRSKAKFLMLPISRIGERLT